MSVLFVLFLETNKRLAYTDSTEYDLFNENQVHAYCSGAIRETIVNLYETYHAHRQHKFSSIYDLHPKATQCYYSKLIRK